MATITIILSEPTTMPVTVTYATSDGTVSLKLSAPVNATLGTPNTATLTIENSVLYLPLITKNHG